MTNSRLLRATLVVASLVLAQPVLAQSGFSGSNETSTADAAAKLLQPTDADPSKTGVSTNLAEQTDRNLDGTDKNAYVAEGSANPDGTDKNAYVAEGGALKLLNCNGSGISVKTYNSNDSVLLIPYQTVTIADLKSASPKCATSTCKLIIGKVKTVALSGYQVLVGNQVRATNAKSFSRGCPAYVPAKIDANPL